MDQETQSRTVIVSPVTIDLNLKTIEEAFLEIGELDVIRLNPQEGSAIVTFKHVDGAKMATARSGATIDGQIVRISLMSSDDNALNRLKDRIQGGTIEISEYEKRAYSILSYPIESREEKFREQLTLLSKQERDIFVEIFRRCESIIVTRSQFDKAVRVADKVFQESKIGRSRSRSRSASSKHSHRRNHSRSHSYSRNRHSNRSSHSHRSK